MKKSRFSKIELSLLGVSVVLAIFMVAQLFRPCEVFRIRTVVSWEEFGWWNTGVNLDPENRCMCYQYDRDDPLVLREGDVGPMPYEEVRPSGDQIYFW